MFKRVIASTARRTFCSTAAPTSNRNKILGNIALLVGAVGGGSMLYDFLSKSNLEKISEHLETSWDDDWDRYVRVPPERQEEIKDWFVPPDNKIVQEREKFDEENNIGFRTIVMVRHGQYVLGEDKYGDLTAVGLQQAALTGKRLAESLKGKKIRTIFHSDMPRAHQTAVEISKAFPGVAMVASPLLAEGIPAEPNPVSPGCPAYEPEEGKRLEQGFRTFFARPVGEGNEESVDMLIGHGNCFRFFICRAMQIDPRFWLRMAIYNAGISSIELDSDGGVSVRGMGDVGHLPPNLVTYS